MICSNVTLSSLLISGSKGLGAILRPVLRDGSAVQVGQEDSSLFKFYTGDIHLDCQNVGKTTGTTRIKYLKDVLVTQAWELCRARDRDSSSNS